MENEDTGSNHGKKTPRRSSNGHISMSDTESTTSRGDSFHSPLRSESSLRPDDPSFQTEDDDFTVENNCKALVPVDMYHSPVPSPRKSNNQASSAAAGGKEWRPWPQSEKPPSDNCDPPPVFPTSGGNHRGQHISSDKPKSENLGIYVKGASPVVIGLNKLVREEPPPEVKKVDPVGGGGLEEGKVVGGEDGVGGEMRSRAAVESILRRTERNGAVRKAALVIRIFEVVACVISFSVMASDRTQGWSGDSFDRYKEYRYCLAVNVVGFVYSGFQAYNLAHHLGTGKDLISHHLRYHFDFSMDQILAYFLMSASSSAATRVDDWITNWGSDKFTTMASASIGMSFLAFLAFSMSALVSGYNLCNRDST
ncbi:uncharacterized protein [Primulina eburnea]|uniref:uncharacterized protein isoform X1 n=1 Tax=Primulina eburnea TaxID=1245227 RepID=UPI003C6C5A8C